MVGIRMDCVQNPRGAIRLLFEDACKKNGIESLCENDWGVSREFESAVLQFGGMDKIPEINVTPLHMIPSNSLVRFRGMVQDMFNEEYFVGAYKDDAVWRTTKYSDMAPTNFSSECETIVWGRKLYYCVPVPGENAWVAPKGTAAENLAPMNSSGAVAISVNNGAAKRSLEEMSATNEEEVGDELAKKQKEEKAAKEESKFELNLNFPLGPSNLSPCLIKVYDSDDSEAEPKLNEVFEFFGILTFDPEISVPSMAAKSDEELDEIMEDDVNSNLPPSIVPRLHCISMTRISAFDSVWNLPGSSITKGQAVAQMPQARCSLLAALSKVFGGDSLAAEYFLLHTISRVNARVELQAMGKLTLNIYGVTEGDRVVENVGNLLSLVLPKSHRMEISVQHLNGSSFSPKKDYCSNRLLSGMLQLSEGTNLLLNETHLSEGRLSEKGIRNLNAISCLMQWQKVEYDFEFYKTEVSCDVPVSVFSTAKSRLFSCDVAISVNPTATSVHVDADAPTFDSWRRYLALARTMDHGVSLPVQQHLESDLVASRKLDPSLNQETFHRWLTLARLLASSHGESQLTIDRWQQVRDMESKRESRLRVC